MPIGHRIFDRRLGGRLLRRSRGNLVPGMRFFGNRLSPRSLDLTLSALRPRTCSRSSGFTLLELLVVLVIATLLLAITPPLITAAIPGVELKASARRVASGLRLARQEAIRSGHDIAFTLDVEARTFQVDGGFRNVRLPEDLELKLEAAETEMRGDHVGAVRFFPDGSSTGGRVVLALDDRGFQVGVQWLTGRILVAPWEAH